MAQGPSANRPGDICQTSRYRQFVELQLTNCLRNGEASSILRQRCAVLSRRLLCPRLCAAGKRIQLMQRLGSTISLPREITHIPPLKIAEHADACPAQYTTQTH